MKLPNTFKNQPFRYQEAVEKGLTKYALGQMLELGLIERIGRGIYIPSAYDETDPEAQLYLATLRCGSPSCICLLSALDYYHVTDQIPKKIWVMVPQSKRVKSSQLQLIRTRNPHWESGIDMSNPYWITDLPRTLVECLLYKRRLGSDVAFNALKMALRSKKVKLQEIIRIANQLDVAKRIRPYMETLAE